jgi:hypothetical protein
MFILLLMKDQNTIFTIFKKLVWWVECLCCIPINMYGLYLECKNPSYEPILDRPIIEALVDHYI